MKFPKTILLPLAAAAATTVVGAAAAPSADAQGGCIQAPKVTKYLSKISKGALDHSFAKLTWSPEFCPNGKNSWRVSGEPVLSEVGAGSAFGVGMNFDAPTRHSIGVTYNGQVRDCLPIGAGYAGISYTGKVCVTDAKGFVGAYINGQRRIFYRFPQLRAEGINKTPNDRWVWTNTVV
jgi:hypothetical protein